MDNSEKVSATSPSSGDEFKDVIKGLIKLLMLVIFLGTIFIWVLMPTLVYRTKWLNPVMRTEFGTSTFFGAIGLTFFMFMFPMVLMACLGCLYLHLKKQKNTTHHLAREKITDGGVFAAMKRPMLVKGPLGIVSATELILLAMFVALLLWNFFMYMRNAFPTITPQSAAKHHQKLWQARLEAMAIRIGLVGNCCLAFLFIPVVRGSSLLPVVGLTSESSIKYHIWLGHMLMTLFTAHGLCFIVYWASMHEISQMVSWGKTEMSNVAGEITLLSGLVMWATTYPSIRRRFFEVFFYSHYLYIVFMLFYVLHVGVAFCFITFPGFYIFMVDRFLRFLQSRDNIRLSSARVLPSDTVELTFFKNKGLVYNPTSILFVNIPSISKLQWHPFSITSSSNLEADKLSIVIKSEGKWSKKLYEMLSSSDHIDSSLSVSVEGPYGPTSTDFLRHESLVMVSGGSGITPFISIIRDLIAITQTTTCEIPKITLICAFKNASDIAMLDLILPTSGLELSSDLNIQIEAFITKEKEPRNEETQKIRTIWFKPNLSDKPISAILGPNSWLCLAAILSSSTLIFMIIIGVMTRYYIYPIDQNKNKYNATSRSILYLLVLCVSIMVTSSAAVLWNKKKYNVESSKQVQNVDVPSPTFSPSSWAYREIESTPQESLVQCTNLHFGERPNLKKILLETKGSSVGVMVCGPKKMRQKVAKICSSGLAENLHFESISFSW
ncbi:Ferric reductase transmembrane component-like domain [Arabidopsis suecica]|uniref:ferric-chelate reductase (NADH) n=1 Tax=Arabidopsis suecica TaxID=45249 RepID=A0A8T1ZGA1_ARASU|nr:Ferric reductase transmembrane component-like domain [Arabidopsis suecica]